MDLVLIVEQMSAIGVPPWAVVVLLLLRWIGSAVKGFKTSLDSELVAIKDALQDHVKATERRLTILEIKEALIEEERG